MGNIVAAERFVPVSANRTQMRATRGPIWAPTRHALRNGPDTSPDDRVLSLPDLKLSSHEIPILMTTNGPHDCDRWAIAPEGHVLKIGTVSLVGPRETVRLSLLCLATTRR
jgi:hypothetical protein